MRLVLYIMGFLALCLGASMAIPLGISLYDGGPDRAALAVSMGLSLSLGAALLYTFQSHEGDLDHRQAFMVVTFGWLLAGVLGALPYATAGVMNTWWDCLFESVSGFTTTGASVLSDVEAMPRGLLFWRSFTHWLGGMGIIVLSVAILPLLGVGGMQLFKAEVPGAILPDKLAPRVAVTARSLWWVYILMTFTETFLLMAGGMSLFDALCHTFGTVATGGFSTKNASVAAFENPFIHWTITFFMFAAGANFFLHFQALRGHFSPYRKDSEFRFYALVTGLGIGAIWLDLWGNGLTDTLQEAAFQTCSILTTTGYATANFEQWPNLARFLLVSFMVIGGCAGSTAGGMKCLRWLIFFKAGMKEIQQLVHPRAVLPIRVGRRRVPDDAVSSVLGFFCWFALLGAVSAMALAIMGIDLETAYTATLACISNVGPGLGKVGPLDNYGWMPSHAKLLLTVCMILGRLEVYTVLVLFAPDFWRR